MGFLGVGSGWMCGWVDGWVGEGWVGGWMCGWMDVWVGGGWLGGWVNGWVNGWDGFLVNHHTMEKTRSLIERMSWTGTSLWGIIDTTPCSYSPTYCYKWNVKDKSMQRLNIKLTFSNDPVC